MSRFQGDLPARSLDFAVAILRLVDALPNNAKSWEIGRQLIRSGTSIGANIREADHALTSKEFASTCNVARREASETEYWLTLCARCGLLSGKAIDACLTEVHELAAILSTVVKRTQLHLKNKNRRQDR